MSKKQPEALRLAEMLKADEWPGNVTLVGYVQECVAELLRQHAENETVRAGYAAARLEIESLKAQLHAAKQINAAQFGLLAASIPGSALRASHGQAPAETGNSVSAQTDSAPSRFGSPELQAMIIARCVEKDQADSGFDYKTAADFLSGKTVSDEALRKFVAASRGAHDARAALHAKMLSLQGELASREAEIALLKRSLLDAEADAAAPQPSPTAQSADSVPAVSDLPPLPAPDLRDVGTKPQEIKEFLKGYATEYARTAIAARAPADSVQEDAARLKVAVDLLEELAEHDSYSTEYDGRMVPICPECGEQEGEHRPSCAFVRAKAYLVARAALFTHSSGIKGGQHVS